jgi:hypothetical protein
VNGDDNSMHGAYYVYVLESHHFGISFPQPKCGVPTMGKENRMVQVTTMSAIQPPGLILDPPLI